ncbi:MAG: HPF/RaiA family ribosome-associated protein [Ferruginibacter sp.]
MTIQFNTDNNVQVHEGFGNKLNAMLTKELNRFAEQLTRLEVHLSDENGHKPGPEDKKCLIEARIKNKQPVAVTANGANYEIAVKNASDKLKRSLDTVFGRMQSH